MLQCGVEEVKRSGAVGNSSLLLVSLTSISVGIDPVYTCVCVHIQYKVSVINSSIERRAKQ